MMKQITLCIITITLLVFLLPHRGFTTDQNTKDFLEDLARNQAYFECQYDFLMEFFNALKEEEIDKINKADCQDLALDNKEALEAYSDLERLGDRPPDLTCKNCINAMPYSLLKSCPNIFKYKFLFSHYAISTEDCDTAIKEYSKYLIIYLTKIKNLTQKVKEMGVVNCFPKINNNGMMSQCPIFLFSRNNLTCLMEAQGHASKVFLKQWNMDKDFMMKLYANESALKAAKMWFTYCLDNNHVEPYFVESLKLELVDIEKRLAEM